MNQTNSLFAFGVVSYGQNVNKNLFWDDWAMKWKGVEEGIQRHAQGYISRSDAYRWVSLPPKMVNLNWSPVHEPGGAFHTVVPLMLSDSVTAGGTSRSQSVRSDMMSDYEVRYHLPDTQKKTKTTNIPRNVFNVHWYCTLTATAASAVGGCHHPVIPPSLFSLPHSCSACAPFSSHAPLPSVRCQNSQNTSNYSVINPFYNSFTLPSQMRCNVREGACAVWSYLLQF